MTGVRINSDGFKEGEFLPTKEEINSWHVRTAWALEILKIREIPDYIRESDGFRKAILNCCGNKKIYDHARMKKQLRKYGGRFGNCGKNMGDYIGLLNRSVINVGYPADNRIYFSTTKN